MYSILIKMGTDTFKYALDDVSGEVFAGSLAEVKEKFNDLFAEVPNFKTGYSS